MKPKLGLLGGGWIARSRMAALRAANRATIAAIADPSPALRFEALAAAPDAEAVASLEKLLELELDGVVIATNGLCAVQAKVALDRGLAVFCQMPVGRNAREAANVVEAAERADRLFSPDRRYRYSDAVQRAAHVVAMREVGEVYALMLEVHTRERRDLRPQLIDSLGFVLQGQRIHRARTVGSDLRVDYDGGTVAEIAIFSQQAAEHSGWIRVELFGVDGTLSFESEAEPHGDPALLAWVEKLASSNRFSRDEVEGLIETAAIVDAVGIPPRLLTRKTAAA